MGLLDDAIKDHLELKRRHGADPGEVARLEHEALGPARREAVESAPADDEPHGAELVEDEEDFDEVPAGERLQAPVREREPDPGHTVAFDPEDELAEEPIVDQPTRQFSVDELEEASAPPAEPVEDIVPADDEPEADEADAEDVLEETPEFLQETPEHDRLWFEQKPPKDFDF